MELTDTGFWDAYWAGCKIPAVVDYADPFDRCLAAALKKGLAGRSSGSVLEVGCAPGKWLAFMAEEMGFTPSGIEYSEAGMAATMKNLQALNLNYGEILSGDFFKIAPVARFDVVMSFGFIEHFDDPDTVIDRHLAWLKPGGALVIGLPNFRGIYRPIQRILDKTILEAHNLDIMRLDYLRQTAVKRGLNIRFLSHIGSFEPALPIPPARTLNPLLILIKWGLRGARAIRRLRVFDNMNNAFFSSYMLLVCEKGRNP